MITSMQVTISSSILYIWPSDKPDAVGADYLNRLKRLVKAQSVLK